MCIRDSILPGRIDQGGTTIRDVTDMIPPGHRSEAERIATDLDVEIANHTAEGNALGTDAEAQCQVIVEEGVPVFVGALGSPGFIADRFKEVGTTVISIVGSTKQAVAVVKDGAEVVIAQGTEGGGHTGHVGTMALLPQVLDAVDVPVVAAGGIGDGRGMAAALLMGCQAVWVGTRFLATDEAGIQGWQKAGIVDAADQSPVISRAYTGKRFRMLPNDWTRAWEASELDPLPMPLQPVLAGEVLGAMAGDRGSHPGVSMNGAGNIAGLIDAVVPAAQVVDSMATEAAVLLSGAATLLR